MSAMRDGAPPIDRARARARAPELELAVRGALVAGAIAVPTIAVAGIVRGSSGVAGAALAGGLVVGVFASTAAVLACVQRLRPATLPAASLAAVFVRMVAYAVLLIALGGVGGIDRPSTV